MVAGFQEVDMCVGRVAERCKGGCGLPGGEEKHEFVGRNNLFAAAGGRLKCGSHHIHRLVLDRTGVGMWCRLP